MPKLTLAQARRIALAAQGFTGPNPTRGEIGRRELGRVLRQLGVVQVDSVNVLARAHYLPFFSRLGGYDRNLLDTMRDRSPRTMVETWAHEASLIPTGNWQLLAHRHTDRKLTDWPRAERIVREQPGLDRALRELIDRHGPLTARQCSELLALDEVKRRDHWGWNWSAVKTLVEYFFWSGQIAATGRNASFERSYHTLVKVLPNQVLNEASQISAGQANVGLVRIAAKALGVASPASLTDYFRMHRAESMPAIDQLVRSGELEPVEIAGLGPHYLFAGARRPRKLHVEALVSPFDSLIWHRERTEQLFGMRYRIGIYTPKTQREFGYYVLPFVFGDTLVARVDLKADRAAGLLRVQQLSWQPDAPDGATEALDRALASMADWLGLDSVVRAG